MKTLSELGETKWAGTCELWMDPLGNEVVRSECTVAAQGNRVSYTWSHEGKLHHGSIALHDGGGDFTDSWHQPQEMACDSVDGALGLFQLQGQYGPQQGWRWRIGLFFREPTGELVLQMTNVAPWGEEARAVRMTCSRQ